MTPPPSARDDESVASDTDGGSPPTVPLAAAALVCGLLAGWALTGAGFAVGEALLVAGVGGSVVYSGLSYVAVRLSAG